jgi:hypothetical protein
MTRLSRFAIVSLSVLAACTVKNNSTSNPDAGNYDGYYSEVKDGGGSSGASGGDDASSDADKPKVRTVTSTKAAPGRKGKSLAARKPPVTGGDKPPRARPQPPAGEKLAFDGYFPTNAPAGSVIEILGSGFGAKGQASVLIGKKRQKVIEVGEGHMLVQLAGDVSGPVVVTTAGARSKTRSAQTVKSETPFHTVVGLGTPRTDASHGLLANVYKIAQPVTELPAADTLGEPFATFGVDNLDIPAGEFKGSFHGKDGEVKEWFAVHFRGSLNVTQAGNYELCLNAGDGALLFLDQTPVVDNDGVHDTTEKCESIAIEPGEYQLDVMWFQATAGELGLQLLWAKDGGAKAPIPRENLFPPEDANTMARK